MVEAECLMFPILKSDLENKQKRKDNIYQNIKTSSLIASIDRQLEYISKEKFFHKYPHSMELVEYINKKINSLFDNVKTHYCSRSISYSSNRVFMNVNINKTFLRVTFLGINDTIKNKVIDISSNATPMNGQLNVYCKKDFDYLYETIKYSYELSLSKI